MAHEIRNPLQAIKFRLFSLKSSLPPGLPKMKMRRYITEEINRLDRIVKDFLQFARPSEPELVRVPAERILQEVQDFMKSQLEQAAIELRLESLQPAWVQADPHQLKQVLINLVQNSADSIGKNGTITLRLKTGYGEGGRQHPARGCPGRRRYGQGHPAGGPEAAVRPVLHDQGGWHRLGPGHRGADCREAWRTVALQNPSESGHDV